MTENNVEIWKQIEGYENKYDVSNLGNVRTSYEAVELTNVKRGRIIKQYISTNGYLRICLCLEGKVKSFATHRLVAKSFIENPNNYSEVDHINCIKTNNCVENLRWVSHSLNNLLRKPMKRIYDLPRGVYASGNNRYKANIKIDGKEKHLGVFDTPEEASVVYETKRKQILNEQGIFEDLN